MPTVMELLRPQVIVAQVLAPTVTQLWNPLKAMARFVGNKAYDPFSDRCRLRRSAA